MDKLLKINLNGNLCEDLFFFVIVLVYFLHSPVKKFVFFSSLLLSVKLFYSCLYSKVSVF